MSSSPTGSSSPLPAGGRAVALAALLAAALLLPFPGSRHLLNPDEPRDAEVAREFADGTWTRVPRLNGEPYFSKPPLFFATVGTLMKATGSQEESTARLGAALHGVAAVAALAALAEVLLGAGTGLLAGLLLLGTPDALLRFRTCTTDAGLAAYVTISILGLAIGERRGRIGWSLAGGAAAGLAALAKALHGLAFPFLAVGIWVALDRERRKGAPARLGAALLCGAAVYGSWLLLLGNSPDAGGGWDAVRASTGGNISHRFGSEVHHAGGWFDYWHLLYRALPWTVCAVAGAWAFRRSLGTVWVVAMVLALSLSPAKRDAYLLPVLPGMALLAAAAIQAGVRGALLSPRAACAVALAAAVATLGAEKFGIGPHSERNWGGPVIADVAKAAGDRPVILFRLGEGDVGQFCFPLRRTLPVARDGADLLRIAAGRPVVVLAEKGVPEDASREKPRRKDESPRLPPEILARWTLLGERAASETWRWYAWDGKGP